MAKSDKAAERRERLEQMRKQEKSQARRRTALMVAPALVLAVVVGVMVAIEVGKAGGSDSERLSAIGVSSSAAGCQDVVTEAAEGNNDHRAEGETIDYDASPPATGPHYGQFLTGGQIRKFWTADDRPPVERLVHSLEHGWTILWYDDTVAADEAQMDDLEALADEFSGTGLKEKFMVAPWTEADTEGRGSDFPEGTHLALTHWSMGGTNGNPDGQLGVWQYCGEVSGAAVDQFMQDYPYSDSPEPNAA